MAYSSSISVCFNFMPHKYLNQKTRLLICIEDHSILPFNYYSPIRARNIVIPKTNSLLSTYLRNILLKIKTETTYSNVKDATYSDFIAKKRIFLLLNPIYIKTLFFNAKSVRVMGLNRCCIR